MTSSSDGTTTSSGMEGLARSRRSTGSSTSSTRSQQLQSPFVSMFQRATIPTLILERIANCLDSMDVLYLSNTCQILQQKLQHEWGGWPCDACQRPLFASFAGLQRMDTSSDDSGNNTEDAATVEDNEERMAEDSPSGSGGSDENMQPQSQQDTATHSASASSSSDQQHQVSSRTSSDNPPPPPPPTSLKIAGCHLCKRRTCPDCTERCIECGITACEEHHLSYDGEMCINAVCTDDFLGDDGMNNHHQPRMRCRGCLNKCRSCEDAYCGTCSSISLCRYCGNSECPYCQDQCFDEAYGYERNTMNDDSE